jgi:putative ABC transport system permease protein
MKLNVKLISRNLLKSKIHFALNIIGLAIGLACSIAVIVWVKNELSYDKQIPDSDRIYRLTFETNFNGNRIHFARCYETWVWEMSKTFPQIEQMVRLEPYRRAAIKAGENKFYSDRIFSTDTNFFKVFNIDLISGDFEKVLSEPHSAVISESLADKCFGKTNPIGQPILLSGEQDTKFGTFIIKGVMKNTPANSHIHFDVLTSFAKPEEPPYWAYVYILLKKNTSPDVILSQFPAFLKDVAKVTEKESYTPYLQKITDIHLYSDKDREIEVNGNITSIWLFIVIAFVLLLVSWVNYYNLNNARLLTLQKQIHIQRINGAYNKHIILQSLVESAISVILSFLLAIMFLDLAGNPVRTIFGFNILPGAYSDISGNWLLISALLIVSLFAGSLPVIIYIASGSNSSQGFKKIRHKKTHGISSYGALMTAQICLSIILMVSAITIYKQNNFMLSHSLGEMSSDILSFKNQNWESRAKYTAIRNRAMQNPLIKSFTAAMEQPSGETLDALKIESSGFKETSGEKELFVLPVEDNFLDFFKIPLIAGRSFSPFNPNRKGEDYILNETALKRLGWSAEEAIGKPLKIAFNSPDIFFGGTVVGVVRDFNFNTVKQEIKPYVLFQKPIFYLCFLVKVDSAGRNEAIADLKKIWNEELPDYPFQYEFISDVYKSAYSKEISQAKITAFFSILAIVIICFGLFSVTSVLVSRRTKEIGIRKVNGAKVYNIMVMLNSDFVKWFTIAFIIAWPVASYIMNKWLQNFVYRTELKWWMFAIAGLVVMTITLLTVSLMSLKTAIRNPVEALRYE